MSQIIVVDCVNKSQNYSPKYTPSKNVYYMWTFDPGVHNKVVKSLNISLILGAKANIWILEEENVSTLQTGFFEIR